MKNFLTICLIPCVISMLKQYPYYVINLFFVNSSCFFVKFTQVSADNQCVRSFPSISIYWPEDSLSKLTSQLLPHSSKDTKISLLNPFI